MTTLSGKRDGRGYGLRARQAGVGQEPRNPGKARTPLDCAKLLRRVWDNHSKLELELNDYDPRGWIKVGAQSYCHHCCARVTKRGRLWTATGVAGETFTGHLTASQAMSCVEERDPTFWSYGEEAICGFWGDVSFKLGYLDVVNREEAFVFYVDGNDETPSFLNTVFRRRIIGSTHCVKCLRQMTELKLRALREFGDDRIGKNKYIVCDCGYPVWQLNEGSHLTFFQAMDSAERSWRRQQRVKAAGGTHTSREIEAILDLQEHRCIYCNAQFTSELHPTKDHLLPVAEGGGNWALNIIMACKSCNSRRGDIPFRTYCTLLSKEQNHRILKHLGKRLSTLDLLHVQEEALVSFDEGLACHDSGHWRFCDIQGISPTARRNVRTNRLLPPTKELITRKYVPDSD